ncbi:hypothetical protein [Flavobacterium sp. DG2-3]|uniref:hypothetical protein n=1 Tax=Flavobacterium sp. DG2-3 TaxID=3068317 RepID=UPI00273F4E68|nr:hypothetical protein [Flavobacterium sp. DG2-3]
MLSSCKNDEKISTQKIVKENLGSETKKDSLKKEKSAVLFSFENQDNTEVIKITASEVSDDNNFFLVGDKNILIASKYKKNKNKLQFIKSDTLLISDYYYVNVDPKHILRKKIRSEDYFLFEVQESPMGNGDPVFHLDFIMLNINTLNFYTLKYSGEATVRSGQAIDGEFLKNEILQSNIAVQTELYEFANKSKLVYNPSEKEKDINYYKNFEQKWYLDNDKHLYPSVIKSTYYNEDLFHFNGNYTNDEMIENTDFKIVSYFRNNIIGFDKNKKLYFPICIESCVSGCNKKIEFISENEIEISYSEIKTQESDTIDLNKIKFTNTVL